MIETVQKPDFVFHLPNKVKLTKEQHEQFNKELNRVTKLINTSNRTNLLAKLREEIENYWFVEIKQGCGCDYDPKQCIIHNLLALIKKAGGEG